MFLFVLYCVCCFVFCCITIHGAAFQVPFSKHSRARDYLHASVPYHSAHQRTSSLHPPQRHPLLPGRPIRGAVVAVVAVVFVVVVFVVVVVVVVVVYLKRLRIVLRCAKAGCGRRTSSS